MTILVTGATGLVGRRLLPRLAAAGLDCRALLRPGKADQADGPFVEGDLADPASLARAVQGVSAVIHLAAVFRTQDESLIWRANRDGTRALIDAVEAHAPTARFILASTAHVYGRDGAHPGREEDRVAPDLAYPASKVAAEAMVQGSALNWAILRFPFVYGDGDGHLAALPGHLSAHAFHPAQRMSTIHHRDIATAMRLALDGRFDGRIVNLADDAALTMHDLIGLAGGAMAETGEAMANPWHLHIDPGLSRALGFRPDVRTVRQAVEDGLV